MKKCENIKARACADGRKQRRCISKEEVASPTVQLDILILSLMIYAREDKDGDTVDVVDTYLLANMEDDELEKLTG